MRDCQWKGFCKSGYKQLPWKGPSNRVCDCLLGKMCVRKSLCEWSPVNGWMRIDTSERVLGKWSLFEMAHIKLGVIGCWWQFGILFFVTFMRIVGNSWLASCKVVEETGVPGENHRLTPSHRQLSHMSRPGFEPRQRWETACSQWQHLRPHGRQSRPAGDRLHFKDDLWQSRTSAYTVLRNTVCGVFISACFSLHVLFTLSHNIILWA